LLKDNEICNSVNPHSIRGQAVKKLGIIGIVASLTFAFLVVFGINHFSGSESVEGAATLVQLDANGTTTGATWVSNTAAAGTGTVTVKVTDAAANTAANAQQTRTVIIKNVTRNKTTGARTLTETGNDTAIFSGTFVVAGVAAENLGGFIIGANDGDLIQVIADSIVGQITVDGKAPTITNISPAHAAVTASQTVTFSGTVTDARSKIDGVALGAAASKIRLEVEIDPAGAAGTFTDMTASVNFTATTAADGYNFSLLAFLSEGVHQWRVKAVDATGIATQFDSDTTDACTAALAASANADNGNNCEEYTVEIDSTSPAISAAVTGAAWNSSTGLITTGNRNSIKVTFVKAGTNVADKLDANTIQVGDFLIGDPGVVPANITFPNLAPNATGNNTPGNDDLRTVVFLEMTDDLTPNAKPIVRVVNAIADVAGKSVSTGSVTATDGIGPQLTMSITGDATSGVATKKEVTIVVEADEASANPTAASLIVRRIEDVNTVTATLNDLEVPGNAKTGVFTSVTDGRKWQWVLSFTTKPGLYNVYISVLDEAGNATAIGILKNNGGAAIGNANADTVDRASADIKTFEVDLGSPAPTISPGTGANGTENTNAFVTIDFTGEATEYGLIANGTFSTNAALVVTDFDTHNPVALTVATAILKTPTDTVGTDITDKITIVSETTGTKMYYKGANLAVGLHEIELTVTDDVGNELKVTSGLDFEIKKRTPISISLIPGSPNLISFPGKPDNTGIDLVIPATVPVTAVFAFDPTLPGQWLTAARTCTGGTCGAFQGNLTEIDGTKALVVLTETSQPLSVLVQKFSGGAGAPGALPTPPPILSLVTGWNLVPVIDTAGGNANIAASTFFSGITTKIRKVYSFSAGDEKFTAMNIAVGADNLTVGGAVWVYMDEPGTLVP
jgi:hypothetical protein